MTNEWNTIDKISEKKLNIVIRHIKEKPVLVFFLFEQMVYQKLSIM